jgi:type IV pilus assembly protein PilV
MRKTHCRRQTGFTLLEVLISMVIIAFGLLGVAGLQVFALKHSQSATFRSSAATLANDIVDRMKTNVGGAIDGAYNQPNPAAYATFVAGCTQPVGCTTADLAANDLAEWQQRIALTLPGGRGIVCLDATPDDGTSATDSQCDLDKETNYVVKIWWTDDRTRGGDVTKPQRYTTSFNR